jgi:DNA-binding NarL/FixJ family response regulator
MKPGISLVIADDHPLLVKGIRAVLEDVPGIEVVGEAYDGANAWRLIQALQPNVCMLDLEMPEMDGLQVERRVARHGFPVRIIFLTMHKNEEFFRQAMDAGALGYLVKDNMAKDVVQCIKAVAAGKHFVAPELSSFLLQPRATAKALSPIDELTPAQREVLQLVARGLTSKEIGEELGISHRTVENHRSRIAEKLGLQGSHSLLRFALEQKANL